MNSVANTRKTLSIAISVFLLTLVCSISTAAACTVEDCLRGVCRIDGISPAGVDALAVSSIRDSIQMGKNLARTYDKFQLEYINRRSPLYFAAFDKGVSVGDFASETEYTSYEYPQLGAVSSYFRNKPVADPSGVGLVDTDIIRIPTLHFAGLHVDKEIFKSEIAANRNLAHIRWGMANDAKQRDMYLDQFATIKAVSETVLTFLNRTVGASLAQTQHELDLDATNQLLKQVSHNLNRMADPGLAYMYRDMDEKFMKCMIQKGDPGAPIAPTEMQQASINYEDCEERCGEMYDILNLSKDIHGMYHYCQCCAEKSTQLNASSSGSPGTGGGALGLYPGWRENLCTDYLRRLDAARGGAGCDPALHPECFDGDSPTYSVVERLFVGYRYDAPDRPVADAEDSLIYSTPSSVGTRSQWTDSEQVFERAVFDMAHYFQDLYGDICYYRHAVEYEEQAGASVRGRTVKKYAMPYYTVQHQIELLRNGAASAQCSRPFFACPTTGGVLSYGICPAFKTLLGYVINNQLEAELAANEEDVLTLWTQASLGSLLSAADFNMLKMIGGADNNFRNEHQEKIVEMYCDMAAMTAFRRLHLRMATITHDALLANQALTEEERNDVLRMQGRVMQYINFASADMHSTSDRLIAGLETEYQRLTEGQRAAAMVAHRGLQQLSSGLQNTINLGGSPYGGD